MKKGISLVSLMVTMVIMVALISAISISGFKTLNNNKKMVFATEINMVQTAVDTYRTKNNNEFPESGSVQLNISGVNAKSKHQFSDEKTDEYNKITLYKINYSDLGITSLRYGATQADTDIYVVSKDTGKVYYAKGLAVDSITYYTLTDDLKKLIKADEEKNVYDGIIFNVSTTEWTLDKVITTVKVPEDYSNVTVSIVGKNQITDKNNDGNYNIYTIDNIDSNYVVVVEYIKDGQNNSTEYAVNNVDKVPPSILKDNVKEGYSEENNVVKAFLLLEGCSDSLSGIKDIKYAYSRIGYNETTKNTDSEFISSYFKTNGYRVYNNVIEIEEKSEYITIYVEDNVGNFSALYYKLSDDFYNKISEDKDITYVISFNANGGSGTMSSGTKYADKIYTIADCGFTPPDGYTFGGWATEKTTISSCGSTSFVENKYSPAANVVVTTYTCARCGTNFGTTKPSSCTAEHQEYREVSYTSGSKYTDNNNLTLYAIWICKPNLTPCTITTTKTCDGTAVYGYSTTQTEFCSTHGKRDTLTVLFYICPKCHVPTGIAGMACDGYPSDTHYNLTPTCSQSVCSVHGKKSGHNISDCPHGYEENHYYY